MLLQTTVIENPWIPQTPEPKQAVFLTLPVRESMYGGAAGGGKSSALLMAALQYVDTPGYAAIIFRRTYKDLALPEAIMTRSKEWLAGTKARWNDNDKVWTFPSGATLTFGYMEHENDKYRYQGAAVQFIGWDELTQFQESQYRYMFSRLRRLQGSNIPLRVRSATNPGGVGHDWVLQRFLVDGRAKGRVFIPANLADNPYLDRDEYLESLNVLTHYEREQLLSGDWFARPPGTKFQRHWFPIVDQAPSLGRSVRFWDLAATEKSASNGDPDYTCGALVSTHEGRYYIRDMRRTRSTPAGVEALIKQTAELDGKGVDIWMEQEPGSSGVKVIDDYARRVLAGWPFRGVRSTGPKELRANPVSSAAEAQNVLLVRGAWNTAFLDEAEAFPGGQHDDQCFVAGTRIMTPIGAMLIERIRVGDIVCSSRGNRRVTASGMTDTRATVVRVVFTNGKELVGTRNHPVFTVNRGYVHLDSLAGDDIIATWKQKPSSSVASRIDAIRIPQIGRISGTTAPVLPTQCGDIRHSIRKSGSPSTVPYRPDARFTTMTEIGTTTPLTIWYALPQRSMAQGMQTCIEHRNSWCISPTFGNGQNPGIVLTKDGHGIENMPARLGYHGSIPSALARNAVSATVRVPDVSPTGFAHGYVLTGQGPHRDGESIWQRSVRTADTPSWPKRSTCGSVPVRVQCIHELSEPQSVYNLTVEDAHDFYANGVLVHNCDAVSGAVAMLTNGHATAVAVANLNQPTPARQPVTAQAELLRMLQGRA